MSDSLEFKPYNLSETRDILKQRTEYAFVPNVWDKEVFELIVKNTTKAQDIRTGLYLMREAANIAEDKSSRKITLQHAEEALTKVDKFTIKKSTDLSEDEQSILDIIKKNSEKKIGDLYNLYKELEGKLVYKSFQRKIDKLQKNKFICVKKTSGGKEGNTTIIKYASPTKKLTEY